MDAKSNTRLRRDAVWLKADSGSFDRFQKEMAVSTFAGDWPLAHTIQDNVLIYDGDHVRSAADSPEDRLDLMAEWHTAFDTGPGVIVIRNAIPEGPVIDRATAVFEDIIKAERASGAGGGDHFAKPGANDRVWNAAEKHCRADPENFAAYFATDAIALAATAWLGRGYQVTAQVNRVNPGGAAQTAHRDYHLGFMTADQLATYPAKAHMLSPGLTLQGAIAHCDMPVETGPTMLLPYSQRFFEGYYAFNRPEFQDYFAEHHVQLPLAKGDALFFNPAVMHGAGTNRSADVQRMANLLQIGSAFGRSIEAVNRDAMVMSLYPALVNADLPPRAVQNVIAAAADGYAFPTNLDRDQPVGGLIPKSQAEQMAQALADRVSTADWIKQVEDYKRKRTP